MDPSLSSPFPAGESIHIGIPTHHFPACGEPYRLEVQVSLLLAEGAELPLPQPPAWRAVTQIPYPFVLYGSRASGFRLEPGEEPQTGFMESAIISRNRVSACIKTEAKAATLDGRVSSQADHAGKGAETPLRSTVNPLHGVRLTEVRRR